LLPSYKLLMVNGAVALFFMGAAVFAALLFTRDLALPLEELTRAARRVSSGELEVAVRAVRHDEIGELGRAFNAMTGRLREVISEQSRLAAYLGDVLDSMPSILAGLDDGGRITQWNARAAEETGVVAAEALRRPVEELLPQLGPYAARIREAAGAGRALRIERVSQWREGRSRYFDVVLYPLSRRQNESHGAVIRLDDVTERERFAAMMVQTEKMVSLGGLAAGMAHEINNPLGGVLQGVQNIIRRVSPDLPANLEAARAVGCELEAVRAYLDKRQIPRFLEGIRESGQRAAHIVANMLEFARRSESRLAPTDLALICDKVLELAAGDYDLRQHLDFRQIAITRDYGPDLGKVPCTVLEIEQVVFNLVKNAAQALARAATPNPAIAVRLRREPDMARIEVADNGPGMDEATRKRVFEPFFTTKEPGAGTGLGLAVSFFIVTQNHGGSFRVESEPGKGATFIVRLPLARRGPGDEDEDEA
jgi:two-component system, NtrC family, sensor kinase